MQIFILFSGSSNTKELERKRLVSFKFYSHDNYSPILVLELEVAYVDGNVKELSRISLRTQFN